MSMSGTIRRVHVDLHQLSEPKVIMSKLIIERKRQGQHRGKVYEVIKSKDQAEVVAVLAQLLTDEDETFFERLAETDKRHLDQNPRRSRRYVWMDSEREGRNPKEVDGGFVEGNLSRDTKADLVRVMCEIADVKLEEERNIEI